MNFNNLNLCLFPQEIFWEEKERNIQNLENKLSEIHPQTDLLIVPETFSTGFPSGNDREKLRKYAERNSGETIQKIKELAKKHNVAITGSFIADTGGLLSNRAFFIEPSGDDTFADKRHLFAPGGEDKVFSSGHKRLNVRFRGWNISVIVCFDLRFPVWCRNVNNEYDLLIVIANWPQVRIKAWNRLLVARALENVAYVAGVDCRGTDLSGHFYDGSSGVFDFKGEEISTKSEDTDLIYCSLSLDKLIKFREKFPVSQSADKFIIIND